MKTWFVGSDALRIYVGGVLVCEIKRAEFGLLIARLAQSLFLGHSADKGDGT